MNISNFFKTTVSNLIYVFTGSLGAVIVIPFYIDYFGSDKYGEWLSIIFFTNILVLIYQSKIIVDSNHITKLFKNKTTQFLYYFKNSNSKIIKELFTICILIIFLLFFEDFFLKNYFSLINQYKIIIFILLLSVFFNILNFSFFSLYRSRGQTHIYLIFNSIKQFTYFSLIIFTLKYFNTDKIELILSLITLILELFFIIIIKKNYYKSNKKDKKILDNKINKKFKLNLNQKKNYMLMYVSSDLIFYNITPIIIGIFLPISYVTSFYAHMQIAKIPRFFTITVNEGFRLAMGNLIGFKKKEIFNYLMFLFSLNFWSFIFFSFFIIYFGEYVFNIITNFELEFLKYLLFIMYIYFFLDSLWRSLQTYSLATNNHSSFSKKYFLLSLLSLLLVLLTIKKINYMYIFVTLQGILLFISFLSFKKIFIKNKVLNYVFYYFFIHLIINFKQIILKRTN